MVAAISRYMYIRSNILFKPPYLNLCTCGNGKLQVEFYMSPIENVLREKEMFVQMYTLCKVQISFTYLLLTM